jgi:hypothetical protein
MSIYRSGYDAIARNASAFGLATARCLFALVIALSLLAQIGVAQSASRRLVRVDGELCCQPCAAIGSERDLDGDGDVDLAVANYVSSGTVAILLVRAGTFGAPVPLGVGGYPRSVAIADLDGDGTGPRRCGLQRAERFGA